MYSKSARNKLSIIGSAMSKRHGKACRHVREQAVAAGTAGEAKRWTQRGLNPGAFRLQSGRATTALCARNMDSFSLHFSPRFIHSHNHHIHSNELLQVLSVDTDHLALKYCHDQPTEHDRDVSHAQPRSAGCCGHVLKKRGTGIRIIRCRIL